MDWYKRNALEHVLNSRYPCTEKFIVKVPDMGSSKILSNNTSIGTALGTYSSVFAEQVLLWILVYVIVLRRTLQGILDLFRCVTIIHSAFSFAYMILYTVKKGMLI